LIVLFLLVLSEHSVSLVIVSINSRISLNSVMLLPVVVRILVLPTDAEVRMSLLVAKMFVQQILVAGRTLVLPIGGQDKRKQADTTERWKVVRDGLFPILIGFTSKTVVGSVIILRRGLTILSKRNRKNYASPDV
jgi:uncharacterized protein YhhL (DUF1145 family)